MLPARVRTVVVDITPTTVSRLADRSSWQATGVVTDAELSLREFRPGARYGGGCAECIAGARTQGVRRLRDRSADPAQELHQSDRWRRGQSSRGDDPAQGRII